MAATIEVKYFNSFWLKKVVNSTSTTNDQGSWPGLPWNPKGYENIPFPFGTSGTQGTPKTGYQNFYIEESRYKGGFNNTGLSLGVRAYVVDDNPRRVDRSSSLIYSGLINSRTGFNETNVFSIGAAIIKDLDPLNGTIQKLYTEDTNLIVFQEKKVNKVLINKNALYSGDQGSVESASVKFLGQPVGYLGEYGISTNPESFAVYGFRKYFTDRDRAAVLRLSRDGITEISMYGMRDYFRDELQKVSSEYLSDVSVFRVPDFEGTGNTDTITISAANICSVDIGSQVFYEGFSGGFVTDVTSTAVQDRFNVTFSSPILLSGTYNNTEIRFTKLYKGQAPGGWDIHNAMYTLSLQEKPRYISKNTDYATVSFDETVSGWTSFFSYKPSFLGSSKNKYYSFVDSNIYEHYYQTIPDNNTRGVFYNEPKASASVTFVFNPQPVLVKNFNTISYEGSNGWKMDFFASDYTGVDPDLQISGALSDPFTYVDSNQYRDSTKPVLSYNMGQYKVDQVTYYGGFDRKENRYVANLINNSTQAPGEIIFGAQMSGIKGYFATVKISTDNETQPGGMKELFSVASNYVMSS